MSQCTTCGTNFVSAPESPTPAQECKYCQIERLTKENAELRAKLERAEIQVRELLNQRNQLNRRAIRAEACCGQLQRYGNHLPSCAFNTFPFGANKCDCGFFDANSTQCGVGKRALETEPTIKPAEVDNKLIVGSEVKRLGVFKE